MMYHEFILSGFHDVPSLVFKCFPSPSPAAQRWEATGRADGRTAAEPTVDRTAAVVRAELLS
jgi:hypothetical protein